MCGRIIQSSGPLRYSIVDGMKEARKVAEPTRREHTPVAVDTSDFRNGWDWLRAS